MKKNRGGAHHNLFSMALSGAIVARAADAALRQPLPGAPPRLAGTSLARLIEPGVVPMAVDLVFSGCGGSGCAGGSGAAPLPRTPAHARAAPAASAPPSSFPGCYEYTYILDGRGMVRAGGSGGRDRKNRRHMQKRPTASNLSNLVSHSPPRSSSARPPAARASASGPATPPCQRPAASSPPPARGPARASRTCPGRWRR